MTIKDNIQCRPSCGACCIAPSISSPIPGMPDGKPAGIRCIHLDDDFRCRIYDSPDRPAVCKSLKPTADMCGKSREEAMATLTKWERITALDTACL